MEHTDKAFKFKEKSYFIVFLCVANVFFGFPLVLTDFVNDRFPGVGVLGALFYSGSLWASAYYSKRIVFYSSKETIEQTLDI